MTQAPTPGPLDSESLKLLVTGDLLRHKKYGLAHFYDACGGRGEGWVIVECHDGKDAACRPENLTFIGRPDADGWVTHDGGENPVPGQWCEVRFSDHEVLNSKSDNFQWAHKAELGWANIIAFRLAPTAPVSEFDDIESFAKRIYLAGHSEGWRGNQMRRDVAHVDAEKGWSLYVSNGALDKSLSALREPVARIIADHVSGGFDASLQDKQEWKDRNGLGYDCEPLDVNGPFKDDYLDAADAILALLSARPLALGGQHSGGEESQ